MTLPTPQNLSAPRRSRRPAMLAVVAAATLALGLSSCSSPGGAAAASDASGKLRVVTTTTQLTDFAAEIGGDDIALHGLLQAGASAHHFDPSPSDLLALAEADVLVVNGVGLESFIDSAIDASGFQGEIITASDGIDLDEAAHVSESGGGGHDHDHAAEAEHDHAAEAEHAEAEHTEADHETDETHETDESHDGHDHGPVNPHIWTSPRLAQGMVAAVETGFAQLDKAHASGYEERAAAYTERLQQLDIWVTEEFAQVPEADRVLVTGHDSLSYYLHDYDIAFAGSILPSFEDNAEPSAAEIDALVAHIKELGVPAIFVESSMSPKLARTIARESGAQVIDAESLYADALGNAESGADTYIDATAHNTRVILEAWGLDPDPLPESISATGATE